MSEQVLYRKYRPKSFDEVVGQEHVIGALMNAVKMNRVAHAYLFSGPRGVGKTTSARLLAKALNCTGTEKPCNKCRSCQDFNEGRSMNLIEIDAASNRGIDEIRELRDSVRFMPASGEHKVYIIDEVHMLTREAFNALLKTLEEPPAHAVFVLATTDSEKVPATIISRTQHYDFRRPHIAELVGRLQKMAKSEGVALDDTGARLIALAAEGSFRDSESILGQIMAVEDKKITAAEVEEILGLPRRQSIKKLFELVLDKDAPASLKLIADLSDAGYDLFYVQKLLLQYYRAALFLKADPKLQSIVAEDLLPEELETISARLASFGPGEISRALAVIFDNMQRFRKTPIPQLPLELTVLELIGSAKSGIISTTQADKNANN